MRCWPKAHRGAVSLSLHPLLCLQSLLCLLPACTRSTQQPPTPIATVEHPPTPPSLLQRLAPLGADASRCLLRMITELNTRDVTLSQEARREAGLARAERCAPHLSAHPKLRAPLMLWGLERLTIGGAWGDDMRASHELTMLTWNLSTQALTPTLGEPLSGRWVRWTQTGVERGAIEGAIPPQSLSLLRLRRPAKPSAERGGWWAHLGLWLPLDHLGYELSFTHPQGWPVGTFGPAAYHERRFASLNERLWWVPPARRSQGRVLYLSFTPSWSQLSRWAWAQLTEPLSGVSAHSALQEGVDAARAGHASLDAWLKSRVRYHYSPLRRYQPRPPLKSLLLGYGDCKDLSALAYTLLHEAGRPAWFALTSQRPLLSSARSIPSMGWFDHVLLWTPSEAERSSAQRAAQGASPSAALPSAPISAWFDPTGPSGSARALRGRWAYVLLSADQGRWVQIGGLSLSGASPTPQ